MLIFAFLDLQIEKKILVETVSALNCWKDQNKLLESVTLRYYLIVIVFLCYRNAPETLQNFLRYPILDGIERFPKSGFS